MPNTDTDKELDPATTIKPLSSAHFLQALGYELRFRRTEWIECAVFGPGDSALGRGIDDETALHDALRQLLPSQLAQTLWEQVLAEFLRAQPEPPADEVTEPPTETETERSETAAEQAETETEHAEATAETTAEVATAMVVERHAALADIPAPEIRPRNPLVRFRTDTVDDAIDALQDLTVEISDATDLGAFAPKFVRYQLLAWTAWARHCQDRHDDLDVFNRSTGIIKRLTVLTKFYWPGQISALRVVAGPASAQELLDGEFRDWEDVALAAEQALIPRGKEDEYGWCDADHIGPPPPDWFSRLGEVRKTLATLLPGVDRPDTPRANDLARQLSPQAAVAPIAEMAHKLRWLRPFADPELWGRQMGLLRWLIERTGHRTNDALCNLVRAEHLPARTWAETCGFDPDKAAKKALWSRLPPPHTEPEAFVAWFADAARLLEVPDLLPRLHDYQALMQGVDPMATFVGKAQGPIRDRWRKVVKQLGAAGAPPTLPLAAPTAAAESEEIELATTTEVKAPILEQARQLVAGKRALLVSNRTDRALEEQLAKAFGLVIESVDIDRNAVLQNAADRIERGRYDLVLCLTGFVGHKHEQVVKDAAQRAGCRFVRADKGRRLACASAIVRDFGRA